MNTPSFSTWIKTDLHIHSIESNKNKKNDYTGKDYSYIELVEKLHIFDVQLFSVTDHNIINQTLYSDLFDHREELIEMGMNFIPGIELDINDPQVYEKTFHTLLFFDAIDLATFNKVLNDIEKNKSGDYPNIENIFFALCKLNDIQDFVILPHFNNKSKSIKPSKGALSNLNYSVFNAYEDGNNITQVQKSLSVYKRDGIPEFPFVIFSDCHDLEVYPEKDKSEIEQKRTSGREDSVHKHCSLLGSIKHPFETLRIAFQDARLRIAFDDISEDYRSSAYVSNYIKKIRLNEQIIELSPYQNSIIGGFGSGKSFLLELVTKGVKNADSNKYGSLINNISSFEIITNSDIKHGSLEELKDSYDIILFRQNERIYYDQIINEESKKSLSENLKIKFEELEPIDKVDFSNLDRYYASLCELWEKSLTDDFSYEGFNNDPECYEVEYSTNSDESAITTDVDHDELITMLETERDKKFETINYYPPEEIDIINKAIKIIKRRNIKWEINIKLWDKMNNSIEKLIETFNQSQQAKNSTIEGNKKIFNSININIKQIYYGIKNLKKICDELEEDISEERFSRLLSTSKETKFNKYSLKTTYNAESNKYEFLNKVFNKDHRCKTLFICLLSALGSKDYLHYKADNLKSNLEKSYELHFYSNFSKCKYDICFEDRSIMKKSSGEKANMLLDIMFEKIIQSVSEHKDTILIIDQPEDNLDNRNIKKKIVDRVKEMKINNKLPQVIFVSHNPNVTISSDSENIIIAEKDVNSMMCNYKNGGIENKEFTGVVCEVLEGGAEALRQRGIKFSITFQKKY